MSTGKLEILRMPSLSSQVHAMIKESIMNGGLKSGQRLVVDRLAVAYGVSPTPVREALARLVQDRIVTEVAPGRLQVVPVTRNYVLDTYWVRSALEGLATELSTTRLSTSEVRRLQDLIGFAKQAIDSEDIDLYEKHNQEFHLNIVKACGNASLSVNIDVLQMHIVLIRQYFLDSVNSTLDRYTLSNSEHSVIMKEILEQRPERARLKMEEHVRSAGKRMSKLVGFGEQDQSGVEAGSDE